MSENSICFLWVVNPMLPKCLTVLEAWGFDYRGMITWAKTDKKTGKKPFFGTGYYVRGSTEHLVFGIRGKIKPIS
jgi:N6-adenosine-specific RNA methylase IME4